MKDVILTTRDWMHTMKNTNHQNLMLKHWSLQFNWVSNYLFCKNAGQKVEHILSRLLLVFGNILCGGKNVRFFFCCQKSVLSIIIKTNGKISARCLSEVLFNPICQLNEPNEHWSQSTVSLNHLICVCERFFFLSPSPSVACHNNSRLNKSKIRCSV